MGVNGGGTTWFGASMQAESRGIFEELNKKDKIFDDALFWGEARKAADLQRRLT